MKLKPDKLIDKLKERLDVIEEETSAQETDYEIEARFAKLREAGAKKTNVHSEKTYEDAWENLASQSPHVRMDMNAIQLLENVKVLKLYQPNAMLPSSFLHIAISPAALPEKFGPQELVIDVRRSSAKVPPEQAPSVIS